MHFACQSTEVKNVDLGIDDEVAEYFAHQILEQVFDAIDLGELILVGRGGRGGKSSSCLADRFRLKQEH